MANDQEHVDIEHVDLELSQALADVARALLAETSLQSTLEKIVTLTVRMVPGCEFAGVSLIEGRRISTPASTSEVLQAVDSIQYETDQGPCLDAIREHEIFKTDDLAEETRWPAFSQRAAEETGVRSILSFRLFAEADTLGALNLYSKERAAFNEDSCDVGSLFAAHAAVAMVNARRQESFERALSSRDVIGRAKGIIMARGGVTDEQAFDVLRRVSQQLNRKLRDVAEEVSDTGALPTRRT